MLDVHQATRYVLPLREGGSLPAVVETDEEELFVVKFRGAGQGAKTLVAEILVAELARVLDLPVPEVVLVELDESFGRSERDPEIQDILRGSRGLNVGLRYLEGAFNFDPAADRVDPELAARIVWLDALVTNIDRTPRNPNLMTWEGGVWLIDHGSALYFHHNWGGVDDDRARDPFSAIEEHVLLEVAGDVDAVDEVLARELTPEVLEEAVGRVPEELLMDAPAAVVPPFSSAAENRRAYVEVLGRRLDRPRTFTAEAVRAQQRRRGKSGPRLEYRR